MRFSWHDNGSGLPSCCWIDAAGDIVAETPQTFEAFLAERENPIWLEVRMTGGGRDVDAALAFGRSLRAKEATTIVGRIRVDSPGQDRRVDGGTCDGGCSLAFLGGKPRIASPGAHIAYEQFLRYSLQDALAAPGIDANAQKQLQAENQIVTGKVLGYMLEMGVDPALFTLATSIAPDAPAHALSSREMVALKIDTSLDWAGPWEGIAVGKGFALKLSTSVSERGAMVRCQAPGDYRIVLTWPPRREALLRKIVGATGGQIELLTKQGEIRAKITGSGRDSTTGDLFIVFSTDSAGAQRLAEAEFLTARDLSGKLDPGEFEELQWLFNFGPIRTDPTLFLRILEVCG